MNTNNLENLPNEIADLLNIEIESDYKIDWMGNPVIRDRGRLLFVNNRAFKDGNLETLVECDSEKLIGIKVTYYNDSGYANNLTWQRYYYSTSFITPND